ncbi:hypothetical protein LLH00_12540 [bacterium]|nr:hypothetical protein [bacterium]
MTRKLVLRLCLFLFLVAGQWSPAPACTIFRLARDGRVWFGSNEDWPEADFSLWTQPPSDGRHGVLYIGFGGEAPACGINDRGLCFDLASVAFKYKPLDSRKGESDRFIVQKLLEECPDVAAALDTLSRYNIALLSQSQLMLADPSGACAVVESDSILVSRDGLQVMTNFRHTEPGAASIPCDRYRAVCRVLEHKTAALEPVRSALAAASVPATQYSVAFDLTSGQVYIWLYHNYADYVQLDLHKEIAAGPYLKALPDLFPYVPVAFTRFSEGNRRPQPKAVSLPVACLDSLCGSYAIAPGYNVNIFRRGDSLYCRMFGTAPYAIVPSSSRDFFFRYLPAGIRFIDTPGGGTDSLRLKYAAGEIPAARLK